MTHHTFLKWATAASIFITPMARAQTEPLPPSIWEENIANGVSMYLTIAINNKTNNDISISTSEDGGNKVKRCFKLAKSLACKKETVIAPTKNNILEQIEMSAAELPKKGRFSFTLLVRQGGQVSHCKFKNVSSTSSLDATIDKSGHLNILKCTAGESGINTF